MSEPDALLRELSDGILTLTLNRPATLNSITPELALSLADAARDAAEDPGVRCVVLTGAGGAFSSGGAIPGDAESLDIGRLVRDTYNHAAQALYDLDKPVIASIPGIAAGAGASLALACDLRIAAVSARIAVLFRRIGAVLDVGASFHLPRIVGAGRAAELALLGDDVTAERALELGLVNAIAPDEELRGATRALATRLATGPFAQSLIKHQLRASLGNDLATQLALEAETQGISSRSHDGIEGVTAFLERRPARFTGR
jgi:2-(1,2-epoxy-1,2-dihydrophenyl)acetyl-CoA isomerase